MSASYLLDDDLDNYSLLSDLDIGFARKETIIHIDRPDIIGYRKSKYSQKSQPVLVRSLKAPTLTPTPTTSIRLSLQRPLYLRLSMLWLVQAILHMKKDRLLPLDVKTPAALHAT